MDGFRIYVCSSPFTALEINADLVDYVLVHHKCDMIAKYEDEQFFKATKFMQQKLNEYKNTLDPTNAASKPTFVQLEAVEDAMSQVEWQLRQSNETLNSLAQK